MGGDRYHGTGRNRRVSYFGEITIFPWSSRLSAQDPATVLGKDDFSIDLTRWGQKEDVPRPL
jgi:hypothetical protein